MSDIVREMIETRRALHRRPEEGWCEFQTTALILERLRALGYEPLCGTRVINPKAVMGRSPKKVEVAIERAREAGVSEELLARMEGYTGAVAVLETGRPGPVTAWRCDIDCVLVTESCDASHLPSREGFASEYPGWMHACGHDGHAAVGLALARWVMEHKDELVGTIKILFQPAEEGVRGAAAMAASGVVDDVDNLIGAHLGTFCRQGEVGLCRAGFLASSKLDVHFHGIPSHAGADPQKGRSALMAACAAAMMIQGIPRNGEGDTRVAVGTLHAGEGRNVTPVHADMELEVRGETAEVNDYMRDSVYRIVDGVARSYEVKAEVELAGEATTLPLCEDLLEIAGDCAKDVPRTFSSAPIRTVTIGRTSTSSTRSPFPSDSASPRRSSNASTAAADRIRSGSTVTFAPESKRPAGASFFYKRRNFISNTRTSKKARTGRTGSGFREAAFRGDYFLASAALAC